MEFSEVFTGIKTRKANEAPRIRESPISYDYGNCDRGFFLSQMIHNELFV